MKDKKACFWYGRLLMTEGDARERQALSGHDPGGQARIVGARRVSR